MWRLWCFPIQDCFTVYPRGSSWAIKLSPAGLDFIIRSSILRALAFQGDVTISAPNSVTADQITGTELPPGVLHFPVVVFNVSFYSVQGGINEDSECETRNRKT